MRKLRKVDPKAGQTVFSFGCPCASCSGVTCSCSNVGAITASWKVTQTQIINRNRGGSYVGGGA